MTIALTVTARIDGMHPGDRDILATILEEYKQAEAKKQELWYVHKFANDHLDLMLAGTILATRESRSAAGWPPSRVAVLCHWLLAEPRDTTLPVVTT